MLVEVTLPSGAKAVYPIDTRHIAYLLSREELFARSYVQFIAERSRSALLKSQLDDARQQRGQIYYPRQWDSDDFAPISTALAMEFRDLGWMR